MRPRLAPGPSRLPPGAATAVIAGPLADAQAVIGHLREVEARIDRLEKSVGRAIGLLQRLLHPERLGKPGAPMGR